MSEETSILDSRCVTQTQIFYKVSDTPQIRTSVVTPLCTPPQVENKKVHKFGIEKFNAGEKRCTTNGNEKNGVASERYLREIGSSGDGGGMGRRAR
jgi:hypothetical protein